MPEVVPDLNSEHKYLDNLGNVLGELSSSHRYIATLPARNWSGV